MKNEKEMRCPLCGETLEQEEDAIICKKCDFHGAPFLHGDMADYVIDFDGTEFYHVDSEGQRLAFRVGPVFDDNGAIGAALWIWYQELYMKSSIKGDILMSKKAWEKVKSEIDKQFEQIDRIEEPES